MRIVDCKNRVSLSERQKMAADKFGDLVKAVVDVTQHRMIVDAELHADEEALLIENGSDQIDLWGINLYPEIQGEHFVEFDSMINMRPSQGNMNRGVESAQTRERILWVVAKRIQR